jgi:YbbR domain-containing protein
MSFKGWFTENLPIKGVALIVALLMHLGLRGDREDVRGYFVPVSATIPTDDVLLSEPVTRVKITVQGKQSSLKRLEDQPLPPIHIDLTDAKDGQIELSPDLFRLPSGVTIASIQPPIIEVRLDKRAERRVQVIARTSGEVAQGYRVTARRVEPSEVEARGPRTILSRLNTVVTEPVDISGRTETFSTSTTLPAPVDAQVTLTPRQVNIVVEIEPLTDNRVLTRVPVRLRNVPEGVQAVAQPEYIKLQITGPVVQLNALPLQEITASVDLAGVVVPHVGAAKRRQIAVDGLPEGVALLSVEPESVAVQLSIDNANDPSPEAPR